MSTVTRSKARPETARSRLFSRPKAGDSLTPATNVEELHRRWPGVARLFFDMVALEPLTTVGILTLDGTVLYMSEQGARLLGNEDAGIAPFAGRSMGKFFPPEITNERLEIFKRLRPDMPPVLIRNLWNGNQLTEWFRRVPAPTGTSDRDIVFVRGRLIPGDIRSLFPPESLTLVYSSFVRLGPLDCLSNQELRVMALIGAGMNVREAAMALFRAEKTIESHCTAIHRKLGLRDRVEVARMAHRAGLTLEDAERTRV